MCFGDTTTTTDTSNNSATTGSGTQTSSANPAVANAATSNLDFVQNLQNQGFQGYTGQQVAALDPAQQASINTGQSIANNGTGAAATNLIGGYASAPAQSVSSNSIASNMSPYMNQYVMDALAPQLQQMDVANAKTSQATDANATGSGAFGDARTGLEQAQNSQNANVAREGLIGSAYNTAFNTAIGAGAQDSSNQLSAANANAGYDETALNRSLGGATALQGLQTQQLGTQTTANTLAGQNTAQDQAALTAQYNQWLMAQQYPFQTAALTNSTVGQAASAMPASVATTVNSNTTGTGTSSTTAPDNSGMALLGAALGTAAKVSDARLKEDIDQVGALYDGTPVFSYRYKNDPTHRKEIGLMAQDVKKRRPDAVITLDDADGTMMVDYGKATERSRQLSHAI